MDEYIKKADVLQIIESNAMWNRSYYALHDDIEDMTAADVAPVRHGRWVNERSRIKMYYAEYCYDCSECGQPTGYDRYPISSFCTHCGAKMEIEEE